MKIFHGPLAGAALMLAACSNGGLPDVARLGEPEPARSREAPPPGADPNSCWGKDATPAVVETVTEQVMLQPASISSEGEVLYPAVYKTETQQRIVQERKELWFETPCSADLTPHFITTLQRALEARGHYRGPINGEMTARTRRAIRSYQQEQGLDSAILSKAAARQLGLVVYPKPPEGWRRVERQGRLQAGSVITE